VAALARLSLSEEEAQAYPAQLSAILDAVGRLAEVDTRQVEPTSHATLAQGLAAREDVLVPSLDAERALANAPARRGTSFAVPKILE